MYESENVEKRIENYQGKVSKKNGKKRSYDIETNSGKKKKKEKVSLCEKNIRTLKRMIFLKEKRRESIITYKPCKTSSPGRRVTIKLSRNLADSESSGEFKDAQKPSHWLC